MTRLLEAMAAFDDVATDETSRQATVIRLLGELEHVFDLHRETIEGPGGLLEELAGDEPRLTKAVSEVRAEHLKVIDHALQLESMAPELIDERSLQQDIARLASEVVAHSRHVITIVYDAFDIDVPATD